MQGTVPKSRDELKYRVEKYLRQIEGEERKQAKLKAIANAYLKQESSNSHYRHSHKERKDGSLDKYHRHSSRKFRLFIKDEPRSHKMEVHAVEKTPQRTEKEKSKYYEYHKSKVHDSGECAILKKEV